MRCPSKHCQCSTEPPCPGSGRLARRPALRDTCEGCGRDFDLTTVGRIPEHPPVDASDREPR